jgi:outer membrane immunogenic protein
MLKPALSAAILVSFAGAAGAADLFYEAPAVAPAAPAYDWSGVYVGGNVGHTWSRARTTDNSVTTSGPLFGIIPGAFDPAETFPGEDGSGDLDGYFGGVQIGVNRQHGAWVYGVEGDYQFARARETNAYLGSEAGPYFESAASLDHFGTLRGRLGHTVTKTVLVYGTAGLAVGRGSGALSITGGVPGAFTGPTFSDTQKEWQVGYAVGAGIEAAIARTNWTVKAEYLYADFGSKTYDFSFAGSDGSTATTRSRLDAHLLRVGLNYRF